MLKYKHQRLYEDDIHPIKLKIQQYQLRSSEKKRSTSRKKNITQNRQKEQQNNVLQEIRQLSEILTKSINSLKSTIEQFKD